MRTLFSAGFLAAFIILSPGPVFAKKIVVGNAGIETFAPRSLPYAEVFEQYLNALISSVKAFDQVNPALFKEQVRGFNCTDEQCVLKYAAQTGMDIVIRGRLEDDGSSFLFTVSAYGTRYPYNGSRINRYTARIDRPDRLEPNVISLIIEEHSGRFVASLLKAYLHETRIKKRGRGFVAESALTGSFDLYRPDPASPAGITHCVKAGRVNISNGKIENRGGVLEGDIVLAGFRDQGKALEEYYKEKKRDAVFPPQQASDLVFHVLLTAPSSAAMPVAAPLAGYIKGDWSGLMFWAVNASPYLYLEGKGLANNLSALKRSRKDISRADFAMSYFSFYMLLAGGMPLVIDSLSHQSIEKAADFKGPLPYFGNSFSAAYFSLVAGGGGHFYRGDRFWGYFYFHLNNVLVYFTMKEFSSTQKYSPLTRTYIKTGAPLGRRWTCLAVLAGVKFAEVMHAVLARERIDSGPVEEQVGFSPALFFNGTGHAVAGLQLTLSF